MGMFFAPVANVVLSSVSAREEGKASGANNAIRELGGVLGVTVLASIFAHWGGYTSGATFVAGLTPAITVGGAVVLAGAVVAALIPARRRMHSVEADVVLEGSAVEGSASRRGVTGSNCDSRRLGSATWRVGSPALVRMSRSCP